MDETGPNSKNGVHKNLEWAGVGACIATRERWATLSTQWRRVLDDFNVKSFHFHTFADKKNSGNDPKWPYHGWGEQKRKDFLFSLAKIANENTIGTIAVLVHVPSYYEYIPEWYRQHIRLPQAFCLRHLLEVIWGDVEERSQASFQKDPNAFVPAAFFFDRVDPKSSPDWYYMINRLFKLQRESAGLENLVGKIIISSKSGLGAISPPLEAADLVTYRARQVEEQFFEGYSRELDTVLSLKFRLHRMDSDYLKNVALMLEQQKYRVQRTDEYWP
jgi:hypothetical protein